MTDTIEAIRERDAELHYCATCGNRVYHVGSADDPHNSTVQECDEYLRKRAIKTKKPRIPDPETGHLCWSPDEHHPFVEGPIPDYEQAERDRRTLLGMLG